MSDDLEGGELEAAMLLLAIRNQDAREMLVAAARPEWFTDLRHQYVFDAITKLHGKGLPVDMAGVKRETALKEPIDSGWFEQAMFLARGMNRETYERVHIPALREAYRVRSLAAISGELCERATNQSVTSEGLLAWLDGQIESLRKGEAIEAHVLRESELMGSIGEQDAPPKNPVMTGIAELDREKIRFDPKKNTVVAARPKHGKTSLVDQIAISLTGEGAVALFNLEMGHYGWRERRVPQIAGVDFVTYAAGEADDIAYQRMSLYEHFAKQRGLYIIEPSGGVMGASAVLSTVRTLKKSEPNLKFVIIDQMQQLSDWDSTRKGEGRDMQPTRIIRELVNGCKALEVHLIMVHQLGRNADNRKDKEPIMADLAETAYFERVADQILFVYRPNFDAEDGLIDDFGFVKFVRRYGSNGRARLSWDANRTKFGTWGDPIMSLVFERLRQQMDEAV